MLDSNPFRDSRLPGPNPGGAGLLAPSRATPRPLGLVEAGLWAVALMAACYLGYVALDRMVSGARQTSQLQELLAATPIVAPPLRAAAAPIVAPPLAAAAAAPVARRPLENGEAIGRLEIPGAGISAIVAAGTDARTLRRGVGHIDDTALPGEPGNVGLAGHRDTVFRGLRKLRPGDRIRLVTAGGSFEYAVESLRTVAPDRRDVLAPSAHPTLTLVTCYPFYYVGPAPLRFVVRARQVGGSGAAASTAGLEGAARSDEARNP